MELGNVKCFILHYTIEQYQYASHDIFIKFEAYIECN